MKVLEGSFRKDRHGDSPAVVGGFPAAPDGLSPSELALWQAFPKPNWIGQTDQIAVHGAVSVYERILRNQKAQQASPEAGSPLAFKFSHDSDGNQNVEPKENPLITQEIKLWARLFSMLSSLGLTPADRAKMTAPKVDDAAEDKWAGIL
jgi:phage terminase small subunit